MTLVRVIASIALAASLPLLQGCATAAAPTSSPGKNAAFDSVVALKNAAVAAGFTCPRWQLNVQSDPSSAVGKESGNCGTGNDLFAVFDGEKQKALMVKTHQYFKDQGQPVGPLLLGPNWGILAPPEEATRLHDALGGDLLA